MKKIAFVVMTVVMVAAWVTCGYAEEKAPQKTDVKPSPMGKMVKPPLMPSPMIGMMRQKQASMETLPDGSVVILRGDKLVKYDKDLNLVREVEVKAGEEMPKPGMICPMCGQKIPEHGAGK